MALCRFGSPVAVALWSQEDVPIVMVLVGGIMAGCAQGVEVMASVPYAVVLEDITMCNIDNKTLNNCEKEKK